MFSALPDPDSSVLKNAPANQVVFSLSIEKERDIRPADGMAWQKFLKAGGYENAILRKAQLQMNVSGFEVVPSHQPPAWQVLDKDQTRKATVHAQGFLLERTNYLGFALFEKEINSGCAAFEKLFSPQVRAQINLRYSNALSAEDATTDFV